MKKGFLHSRSPAHLYCGTDSGERRRWTTGAALLSHGRTPPPVPQTETPAPKQMSQEDMLTHRGVVGHSLQFLDNVYIQQLKGQQVLEIKMASNSVCSASESHTLLQLGLQAFWTLPGLNSVQIHAPLQSSEIKKSKMGTNVLKCLTAGRKQRAGR